VDQTPHWHPPGGVSPGGHWRGSPSTGRKGHQVREGSWEVENEGRILFPPLSPEDSNSDEVSSPCAFVVAWATPLSHIFCSHACCLSFLAQLTSRLTTSLTTVNPYGSLFMHPRSYNMRVVGIKKGRN
jgi:hypothetical protein